MSPRNLDLGTTLVVVVGTCVSLKTILCGNLQSLLKTKHRYIAADGDFKANRYMRVSSMLGDSRKIIQRNVITDV